MKAWHWYKSRFAMMRGRINRRQMVLYMVGLQVFLGAFLTFSLFVRLFIAELQHVKYAGTKAPWDAWVVFLIFGIGFASLMVRRFHDFGKSGLIFIGYLSAVAIPAALEILLLSKYPNAPIEFPGLSASIALLGSVIGLGTIIVPLIPGSKSDNKYGPAPDDKWTISTLADPTQTDPRRGN